MKKNQKTSLLIVLVIVSLVSNVFFIGYLFGNDMNGPMSRPRGGKMGHMHRNMHQIAEEISPEKRGFFKEQMDYMRSMERSGFGDMRRHRQEIFDIITAEKFDPEAFKRKTSEVRAARIARNKLFTETMVKIASGLDQADREALANNMRFHRQRKHR